MKIHLILFILGIPFFNITAEAAESQESQEDKVEKLKSEKVAFLTEQMGLSPADAQKFWPVYNEFSHKSDSLWHLQKSESCELKEAMNRLTNDQKEAAIDQQVNFRWEKARLERDFHRDLKKILTIDQVIKFYEAEHEFKRKLLRLLRGTKTSYHQNKDMRNKVPESPTCT